MIDQVDGSVTEYRFSEQKENDAIPEGRFRFSPPAGTETVESPSWSLKDVMQQTYGIALILISL